MNQQPSLFDPPTKYRFAGPGIEACDEKRLGAQLERCWAVVKCGSWFSLAEIAAITHDPESSISARLRQFRGMGHVVSRRRRGEGRGTWEYRVEVENGLR